jgi:hypothetical protein
MAVTKRLRFEILRRDNRVKHTEPLPAGWQASVRNFLAAGLDLLVLDQCVTITMESNPREAWSYFCGICWRTVERAQRIAETRD